MKPAIWCGMRRVEQAKTQWGVSTGAASIDGVASRFVRAITRGGETALPTGVKLRVPGDAGRAALHRIFVALS